MIHVNITKKDKTQWQKQFETLEEANAYVENLPMINEWGHDQHWSSSYHADALETKDEIDFFGNTIKMYLLPKNYIITVEVYKRPWNEVIQEEYIKEGCTVEALVLAMFEDHVQDQEVFTLSPRIREVQEKRLKVKAKVPKK
jgi:hypothetical protein